MTMYGQRSGYRRYRTRRAQAFDYACTALTAIGFTLLVLALAQGYNWLIIPTTGCRQ